ncbi:MAG: DRTGG domain-containing protein [Christensenellales bacterium]|jgi:predicted transcriptional regulator
MTLNEIVKLLDATVLSGSPSLDQRVDCAFASDLMSDVLAYVKENTVLLTGLINKQSIRTAEMLDLPCIVFVRGKRPDSDSIALAQELDLPLLCTCFTMYEACGRLFAAGMPSAKLG